MLLVSAFQRKHGLQKLRVPYQWLSVSFYGTQPGAADAPGRISTRLEQLVKQGALQPDERQMRVAGELDRLCSSLTTYSQRLAEHRIALQAYQATRQARLLELAKHDEAAAARHAAEYTAAQAAAVPHGTTNSWMPRLLPWQEGSKQQQGGKRMLTPEQRAKLRAAERERKVTAEMGPTPAPPLAPKGLYICGSVGSGKTLLMDMFYAEVAASGVTHHRRAHFNAAMVELNSRMHALDVRVANEAKQLAESGPKDGEEDSEDDSDDEAAEGGQSPEASNAATTPTRHSSFFKFWDEGVMRQRVAKKAVLAIRRHMRLAQLGRTEPDKLARANSASVAAATLGFIRGLPWGPAHPPPTSGLPEAAVLCLDEMQVADVFSAIVLKGLVEHGLGDGVLVCTSNRSPDELPRHGLHEAMFNHFVRSLELRCKVVSLSAAKDYRVQMLTHGTGTVQGQVPVYMYPLTPATSRSLEQVWQALCDQVPAEQRRPVTVPVAFGRTLEAPLAAGGAVRFTFDTLCGTTKGPTDYIALASHFHTLVITDVPAMNMQVRDRARRFITLIDELYNARMRIILSAEEEPDFLFGRPGSGELREPILDLEQLQFEGAVEGSRLRRNLMADGSVAPVAVSVTAVVDAKAHLGGLEEQFSFARAVSRIKEMTSQQYLNAWAARHAQRHQ